MARQSPTTQFNCLSVTLTVWFWCCAARSELREPIAEQTVGSERSTQVSGLGRPMMRCCKKATLALKTLLKRLCVVRPNMVQQTDDVGGASAEADSCKSARLDLMLQECEA